MSVRVPPVAGYPLPPPTSPHPPGTILSGILFIFFLYCNSFLYYLWHNYYSRQFNSPPGTIQLGISLDPLKDRHSPSAPYSVASGLLRPLPGSGSSPPPPLISPPQSPLNPFPPRQATLLTIAVSRPTVPRPAIPDLPQGCPLEPPSLTGAGLSTRLRVIVCLRLRRLIIQLCALVSNN